MQTRPAEIGPRSPRHRLRRLDRRTREGRFLASTEKALLDHLGGADRVSTPRRILCERISSDLLRLELLDEKSAAGEISDHECRIAHALRNSVRLMLRECGLDAVAPVSSSLDVIRAGLKARGDAA
jgi:hypothetical protein